MVGPGAARCRVAVVLPAILWLPWHGTSLHVQPTADWNSDRLDDPIHIPDATEDQDAGNFMVKLKGGRWEDMTCESLGWPRSKRMRRIVDGFCYNGETDILRLRRMELGKMVNGTAILTTALNFHGQPHKKAHLPKKLKADNDVKHMTLPGSEFDTCRTDNNSINHYCALSVAKNGVADVIAKFILEEDDWIIFGDPDEIPNREVVRLLHECEVPVGPEYQHNALHLNAAAHYLYDTHCNVTSSIWVSSQNFKTPVALKVATMQEFGLRSFQANKKPYCTPHGRYASCGKRNRTEGDMYLPEACWHLSSFGGMEQVQTKVRDNSDRHTKGVNNTMIEKCLEFDKDRQNPHAAILPEPAREYPHVPHALHDSKEFKRFFHADYMSESRDDEDKLANKVKRVHRRWRKNDETTSQVKDLAPIGSEDNQNEDTSKAKSLHPSKKGTSKVHPIEKDTSEMKGQHSLKKDKSQVKGPHPIKTKTKKDTTYIPNEGPASNAQQT